MKSEDIRKQAFSSRLKSELCAMTAGQVGMTRTGDRVFDDCCSVAFLRAVLLYAGRGDRSCTIRSENSALLEICAFLLIKYYNIEAKVIQVGIKNKSAGYKLELDPRDSRVKAITDSLCFCDGERPVLRDFVCDSCFKAFLRGAFLSCGTILDPSKGYHLELSCSDEGRLDALNARMEENGIRFRKSVRKSSYILYMKGSGDIEDFLTLIGGQKYALEMMEVIIERERNNNNTRRNNSEVANLDRACTYAAEIIGAIYILRNSGRFDALPEALRETALLREQNPFASLTELCALSGGKLTKSGLNHRFRKIMALAENEKNKERQEKDYE